MKNKLLFLVGVIMLLALLTPVPANAYVTTVTGELRNSKTNALWEYGGSVEIFDCNTLATIYTGAVAASPAGGYGTFSTSITAATSDRTICVEVQFTPCGGCDTPGNAAKGPFLDRSGTGATLNTGVYFTGTGPTAVELIDFVPQQSSNTGWIPPVVMGLFALVSGALALIRRRSWS